MSTTLTCVTCKFWHPARPNAFVGDCDLGVYYGRPTFDYDSCAYHSERGTTPDAIAQQSQARGLTMQEWQRRLTGR